MSGGEKVRIRPGTRLDARQNRVPAAGSVFDIDGCVIEPLGGEESHEVGRQTKVVRIRIYAPGPVEREVTETDLVDARGHEWEVDGGPDVWVDDDPELSGPVITARRVIG